MLNLVFEILIGAFVGLWAIVFTVVWVGMFPANKLRQLIDSGVLLINGKLRVTDNVDEKDVRDLSFNLLFCLDGHFRGDTTLTAEGYLYHHS